jgi:hypothetical protein
MSSAETSSGTPRAVSLRTASVVASARRAWLQTRVARPGEPVGRDPVARLVVEERVHVADLDRHPEGAELLLVALEHLLEPLVGGVRVEDRADPLLADVVTLDEQHDEQVEQPLALARRDRAHAVLLPVRCGAAQPAARMSTTK